MGVHLRTIPTGTDVGADRQRSEDAARMLLEIPDAKRDYDLAASAVMAARRGDRLA